MKRLLILALTAGACTAGPPQPVTIDAAHDGCEQCRMIVSDTRLAAQLVTPGEEPRIFDDIGCLRDYLAAHATPPGAAVFVAEHRTGKWIDATGAVYTHTHSLSTPMASGIVAHANANSRDRDPAATGGDPVSVDAVLRARATGARR